jgi:hypothetical protein
MPDALLVARGVIGMENTKEGALGTLVGKVEQRVEDGQCISVGMIREVAGQRAAGPMLMFPALVMMSPASIIPGVPTLVGVSTVLIAGQIALGREQLWLPRWLSRRRLPDKYGDKLVKFLKPVSEKVDAVAKPRWQGLIDGPLRRVGAGLCVLVGMIMPVLEVIPFTSTWAGAIVATYGLAITARDGLLAVVWIGLVAAVLCVAGLVLA